jgi:hypothetical protein
MSRPASIQVDSHGKRYSTRYTTGSVDPGWVGASQDKSAKPSPAVTTTFSGLVGAVCWLGDGDGEEDTLPDDDGDGEGDILPDDGDDDGDGDALPEDDGDGDGDTLPDDDGIGEGDITGLLGAVVSVGVVTVTGKRDLPESTPRQARPTAPAVTSLTLTRFRDPSARSILNLARVLVTRLTHNLGAGTAHTFTRVDTGSARRTFTHRSRSLLALTTT